MLLHRIFLIILIIITAIFVSFYGGNISYAFFYMSLAIPLISLLYTFYVYIRLKMYQTIGKRTVVKGEITEFIFQLSNEDLITYQNIKVDFYHDRSRILDSNEAKEYRLLPGEIQSLGTLIRCNYMGEYYVGAQTVTITDFLYLFSITYPVLSKMKVLVLPRVVNLSNIKSISITWDSKRNLNYQKNEEEEADIEVRKYVSGDNKKLIHWKASAKKQELLTRKNISIPKTGVNIIMDLSNVEEDDLTNVIVKDKIMECTLAMADYCIRKLIPCEINYEMNGLRNITIQNQLEFDYFYQQCVDMRFAAKKPIDEVIMLVEARGLSRSRLYQYIVITHYITEELYKSILHIVSNGNECGIIYVNEYMTQEANYLLKLIINAGVNVTIINHNDEIKDVL